MANLGQLVVNLEANIAQFQSDMGRASQATEQAMSRINSAVEIGKAALGALGVAVSMDVLVGEANRAIGALADLDDMAQKTGASVEMLSRLGKVAAFTGTDLGAVDDLLVKLSKNLAAVDEKGNKTAKALAAIGISVDDIKGKDPAQVFVMIANKLQGYEDGAGKVALVTDLMSKSAAGLLPYMNDVAESIDGFTGESAEAAAAAAKFQDDLGRLKVKYDEVTTSIVTAAVPAATDFIGALQETTRQSNNLTTTTTVDSWADDVAVGLARVVDVAALIPRMFETVHGSFKAVFADIELLGAVSQEANPFKAAYKLAIGDDPTAGLVAALDKRNTVVDEANKKLADLWNVPANRMEQSVLSRIAGRYDASAAAGADALAGIVPAQPTGRTTLDYSGSDGRREKTDQERAVEQTEKLIGTLTRQRDTYGLAGAAVLEYQLAQEGIPRTLADKAVAVQRDIDQMDAVAKAQKENADAQKKADEEAARAQIRNSADVERIRQSLMTDLENEQFVHDTRMEQLRIFHDAKFENVAQANALIEAETARHEATLAEMDRQRAEQRIAMDMQLLQQAGGVADQMYSMLKQAGLEQTALGKAAFLASKAIAVAQIILSTNVAAAAALSLPPVGLGPVAGLGLAGTIKAMGYASAAMTAGLAIAEASAEGGYDIPAGVNPVTQLHEKEMVLPKAQAEVIRGLAARGGAGGGGGVHVTYSPVINIDSRTDQREVQKMVYVGVQQGNADLVDKLQRAGKL